MELKIGCTGWGYKEWEGAFYPKTVKRKGWLRHYSSVFDTTEVNSSFYHAVPRQVASKWNDETPKDFSFSLKFPQKITHDHRLDYGGSKEFLTRFLSGLEPLKEKIRVLVMQLPPSLEFEEAKPRLEELSGHLPHYCRFAVEGRHESWFFSEALDFLRARGFCLVWNEVPMVENPAPVTADFVYARLIGDRNLPQDAYGRKARDRTDVLEKWRDRLLEIKKDGGSKIKFSWMMLNNHLEGFAPGTANTLRSLLGMGALSFSGRAQKSVLDFENSPPAVRSAGADSPS